MTHALILGVGGQDGAYLARLLIARGISVAGSLRSDRGRANLAELGIADDVTLHPDADVAALIAATAPRDIYDLRGPAPGEAIDVAAIAARTRALLDAAGSARVLVAGGGGDTAFADNFSAAKAAVSALVAEARNGGRFAVTALLSEHASRLSRGSTAAQLIAQVRAAAGGGTVELDAPARLHDWGWAPEYVDALWRMLSAAAPADHTVATGAAMTEHDFAVFACNYFGVDPAACGPAPPPSPAGLAPPVAPPVPGWRAFTCGRDLVETLCEGAAA